MTDDALGLQQAEPEEVLPLRVAPIAQREAAGHALVGTEISGWKLERFLGVGKFTLAFEAERAVAGGPREKGCLRLVEIGEPPPDWVRSHFVRAAYVVNRFRHPRVVSVVADGVSEGRPFVVRAWHDAKTLQASVEDHPLPVKEALRIAEQVLDALEIAHVHGIVHGAISASNILVVKTGSMRLVDFALPPGAVGDSAISRALSETRVDPALAPERESGSPATEAADIYSVGACLYFAISGRWPAHRDGRLTRSLRETRPDIAEDVSRVVDLALEADPNHRYESAYAMLGDIRRVMAGRKPKLKDAVKPVPSGSYRALAPSSSRRIAFTSDAPTAPTSTPPPRPEPTQVRGNLFLLFAIATLVGVATFVVVRERKNAAERPLTESSDN